MRITRSDAGGRDGGLELGPRKPDKAHKAPGGHEVHQAHEERAPPANAKETSPFGQMLRALGREVDRGEATVKRVLSPAGAEMSPGELLALQAGIYRYSEAVDLSAKLVDRATSGLKTVLQGQS
jgi:hypothetical protein